MKIDKINQPNNQKKTRVFAVMKKKGWGLPDEKSGCLELLVDDPSEGDEDKLPRLLTLIKLSWLLRCSSATLLDTKYS